MTPKQFKAARKKLGLSQSEMADALAIKDPRTIRRYESGEREISGPVALLIERLLQDKNKA